MNTTGFLFLDVHTHRHQQEPDTLRIVNLHQLEWEAYRPDAPALSLGLHPWFLDREALPGQLRQLETLCSMPNVKAVGEAGLDHNATAPAALQEQTFEQQALLAERLQKPLIIHCVKAWNELLAIRNRIRPTVPWIVHGFNQQTPVFDKLIAAGFTLSFGQALLREGSNAATALPRTPENRFLLETDDKPVAIGEIYSAAAALRHITLPQLQHILLNNYHNLF